jgi:uncharacterized membrane protein
MYWIANMARRLVSGLAELSPSCKTAARLQSEALDHKLTWRQQLGLSIHLVLCKWCSRYGKQIAFVHNAVHLHPDQVTTAVSQKLSSEARERIRKQLRAAKQNN